MRKEALVALTAWVLTCIFTIISLSLGEITNGVQSLTLWFVMMLYLNGKT